MQRVEFLNDQIAMFGQFAELIVLLIQKSVIRLSGGCACGHEVWFSHTAISPQATYRVKFGASVKFGQEFSGLLLKPEAFHARIVNRNDEVFRAALKSVSARFPVQPDAIEVEAREAIKWQLAQGSCTREDVARLLKLSVRTLNRKLNETDKSFEALRDEVRRNLTIRYLGSTELSFTEIAAKLGYSELAALSHSCRRWFESSPTELRLRLTSGGGGRSNPIPTGQHKLSPLSRENKQAG